MLWRNVSEPVVGGDRWISLELELWTHAARNPDAREHLVRRYRGAWRGIVALADQSADAPSEREGVGPAVIGVLLGLELMRRVDPATVTDELAVAALVGVVAGTTHDQFDPMTGAATG